MITISLCMIVKDEVDTLERCLESIKDIPNEIIIVDTGSKDLTKEIALNWTPHVLDFKWIDDFSAARNYSFDQATMDYILWLDADDILLPEDRQKLLELKQTLDPTIDAVSMIYHTLFDEYNNVLSSIRRLRLVKQNKHFRWYGYVHEDVKAEGPCQHYDSNIIITHKKDLKNTATSDRNLTIYERAIRKGKKMTPHDIFHYARELQKHQLYDKAIKFYLRFLNCKDIEVEHRLYVYNKLASCYFFVGKRDKEREITLKSFACDIPRPEFCCRLAEQFLENKQYVQAVFWYKMAIEVPMSDHPWVIESQPFRTWLPHKQLALCYFHLADYERSLQHNQLSLTYLPDDKDILQNIQMLKELVKESTTERNSLK
ncbi:tetratricopeptide repeat-containing glycosyltransferase family 2 protein [Peribacillus sp. NPDC096540]|uniref:tetratricopeptide repeat-containing glycosyltransferase family 2 protein n=1 Tax=Peribacillus sp. NPDC096540 TaxID=3390612 RepID=UPI003CFDFDB4